MRGYLPCVLFLGFGIGVGMLLPMSLFEVRERVLQEQIDKYVGYSVDLAVCNYTKDRLEQHYEQEN